MGGYPLPRVSRRRTDGSATVAPIGLRGERSGVAASRRQHHAAFGTSLPIARKLCFIAAHVASTGLLELDSVLGGLYWGDNVVLDAEREEQAAPFYAAVLKAPVYEQVTFVRLRDAGDGGRHVPRGTLLDARPGTPADSPQALLEAVVGRCTHGDRHLVLFDELHALSDRWGAAATLRFFSRACPLLLGLGAIAYWSLTAARHAPALRRGIEEITQCVLVVSDDTVRIAKAEGRSPGVEGTVFRYSTTEDGALDVAPAPAAARLGAALRTLRADRRLSQSELARLAGVSASAISQAERGRRGLSLETLLGLADRLDITLDELLRGEIAPGYRLARRDDPRHADRDRPVSLLHDRGSGMRVYLVRLSPGGSARPEFTHKGVEVVTVASGLIQVQLATGRPVLRQGEALSAERSGVEGWRNLSDREALAFWILLDPPEREVV